MSIVKINSGTLRGTQFVPVTVETQISSGIGIHLVGLADQSVKESLLRVVTALQSLGYSVPGKKIVINLSPADLRKEGSGFDLAIALGIIYASGQAPVPEDLDRYVVCGELALDGSVRAVAGGLLLAEYARGNGKNAVMPHGMALEAVPFGGEHEYGIFVASSIKDSLEILSGERPGGEHDFYNVCEGDFNDFCKRMETEAPLSYFESLSEAEQRAVMIAAAGGFDITVTGKDDEEEGCGRRIARALRELLPARGAADVLETAKNYSAKSRAYDAALAAVPFRDVNPYASSLSALDETVLAHGGVLLAESFTSTPKSIRELIYASHADGQVKVSRLKSTDTYPTRYALVTSVPQDAKLPSDFIETMRGSVQLFSYAGLAAGSVSLEDARRAVAAARSAVDGKLPSGLSSVEACTSVGDEGVDAIGQFAYRLGLSVQCISPIARVAIAISRLDGCEAVTNTHIAEACSYKFMCRA